MEVDLGQRSLVEMEAAVPKRLANQMAGAGSLDECQAHAWGTVDVRGRKEQDLFLKG